MDTKNYSSKYLIIAIIAWLLTISWVIVIFVLSSENASESTETSGLLYDIIYRLFSPEYFTHALFRKFAHIAEFANLTVFTYIAIHATNKVSIESSYAESPIKILKSDNEMVIIFTLWFCGLNAIFDEYHQLYVSGREGSITDVLIDSIGIIVVLAIFRLIFTITLKARGRKEVRYS